MVSFGLLLSSLILFNLCFFILFSREIIKHLPKLSIPLVFYQIESKINNLREKLSDLNNFHNEFTNDIRSKREQLSYYESHLNEYIQENKEIINNLDKMIYKYNQQYNSYSNKFYVDNLNKIKSKIDYLLEFLKEKLRNLNSERYYLKIYKTLNFHLIFDSQRNNAITEIYTFDSTNAELIYYNIISYCIDQNKRFVDYYFSTDEKKLFVNTQFKEIKWLRPEYINTDSLDDDLDWCIYKNPSIDDLKHGLLGNYWLLSSMEIFIIGLYSFI